MVFVTKMDEIKLATTHNNKQCLVINGYKMVKNKVNDKGVHYWYCVNKYTDAKCRSTCSSVICDSNHVLKNNMTDHNHAPQPGK